MMHQELENISVENLLELREMIDAEIRRKKIMERNEALKKLREAWINFRKVATADTHWVSSYCEGCEQNIDVDLYDLIDAYGFK